MGNYRKESSGQKLLEPLKDRPHLEPDEQFVNSLRKRILSEGKKPSSPVLKKPVWTYFLVSVMAAGLFFLLAFPYLSSFNDKASEQPENNPSEKAEGGQSLSFDEITAENEAYSNLYDSVCKALTGPYLIGCGPPKTIVYYFESLRLGDAAVLQSYLFEGDLQTAKELIKHYEGMDHSSLLFENMIPGDDGESYDLFFSYSDAGEMKAGSLQLKITDENKAYIHDLPEEEGEVIPAFELTGEEANAFEAFAVDHDQKYLKGLSPISIAKLYVEAQLNQDYETKYALYTSRDEYRLWTLAEELAQSEKDMLSTGALLDSLGWVAQGEFIQDDKVSGHIEYTDEYGNMRGFNMILDEDGIWKVAFLPIQ